ncbi:MAG: B12-binding domain-containing radical SAM protein [Myxococcales bacterium]|nr:B12-binding domain-containing radical SAM protein [Myxococcales bacterium]
MTRGSAPSSDRRVDLVLIYPPWAVHEGLANLENCLPPLGILSIASHVESMGYRVLVYDIHAEGIDDREVRRRLRRDRPLFVGMTVLTPMVVPAHKIARIAKEEIPDCTVVLGGVHAEALPERMLANSSIDVVVRGDGEDAMVELLEGQPHAKIAGLSHRESGRIVHNAPRPLEMNLDRFPFPAYHLIDMNRYFPAVASYRNLPATNLIMTRGCPGRCTYCNSARTTLRARDPARVVEQIRMLHRTYGIRQIQFYDDTFTVSKKVCLEFCRLMEEASLDVSFTAYIRGDCFSETLAAAMKRAGCNQVLVGVESGNEAIARRLGKTIDKERYREAVRIAHRHGLEVRGSFMSGNLGDTWQSMMETLEFAIELDVDLFQLFVCMPYPGTAIFNEAMEKGWLRHTDWYEYGQGNVLLDQPQLSDEEIYRFNRLAYRRFYVRPRSIRRALGRIASWHHLRDYLSAAAVLLLGHVRERHPNWGCWKGLREEDFLDLPHADALPARLTWKLRQRPASEAG